MRNKWAPGCHAPPLRTSRSRLTVGSQAHLFGLESRNPHFPIGHGLLSADSRAWPPPQPFLPGLQKATSWLTDVLIQKAEDIGYLGPGRLLGRSVFRCLVAIESFICFSGNQDAQLVVSLSTIHLSSMLLLPTQPSLALSGGDRKSKLSFLPAKRLGSTWRDSLVLCSRKAVGLSVPPPLRISSQRR